MTNQFITLEDCRKLPANIKKLLIEKRITYQLRELDLVLRDAKMAGLNPKIIKRGIQVAKAQVKKEAPYHIKKRWQNDHPDIYRPSYHRRGKLNKNDQP